MMKLLQVFSVVIAAMAIMVSASSHEHLHHAKKLVARDDTRYVFAHFMIGIVANRKNASDYDADMQRAKSYGIDAFALNIGTDSSNDQQLQYAYESAAKNGMKVFISFDFAWWSIGAATQVGQKIAQYASQPAQLMVDGKAFVSSFAGDGVDVHALRNAAGIPIYFAPNFNPAYGTDLSQVDGALNWMGWPNNGNNKAPNPGQTGSVEAGDARYRKALGTKGYIAPVSPWFFTHYGKEVSYSKNWLFPADLLWYQRWQQLLTLGSRFVEIVSWNDYGESHYVGPLSSKHVDDGASRWVNDMPHNGWLDMAKPFIAAYKAGAPSAENYITSDQVIYWYRPQSKNVDCSATDTCMAGANNASGDYFVGPPNGWQTVSDSVFVVSLLKSAATLQVMSGSSLSSFKAPAGVASYSVPMGVGQQKFSLTRGNQTVLSATSLKDIIGGCVCGLYNYNAYVGTLPDNFQDSLLSDGLAAFTSGLRVSTCSANPSLSINSSLSTATTATTTTTTTSTGKRLATSSSSQSSTLTTSLVQSISSTSLASKTTTMTTTATTTTKGTTSVTATACVSGTGSNNYGGLCSFCCRYDYCPPGPCTCMATGAAVQAPAAMGINGAPKDGLDSSYAGLCSFACNHGYCPDTACKVVN